MKRFRKLLQPHLVSPIVHSVVLKIVLSVCLILLWHVLVNLRNSSSSMGINNGFFFLAVYFFVWTWLQYLALDGFRPFGVLRQRDTEGRNDAAGFPLKDLIHQRVESFEELDEEEEIAVRMCANLLCAVIHFVLYGVFALV